MVTNVQIKCVNKSGRATAHERILSIAIERKREP